MKTRKLLKTSAIKKKKLSLTIEEDIITTAIRQSNRRGISFSQIFEQAIGSGGSGKIETESQRAAKRLLSRPQNAESNAA